MGGGAEKIGKITYLADNNFQTLKLAFKYIFKYLKF